MGKSFNVDTQALSDASKKLNTISVNYTEISNQLMEKAQTMGAAWDSEDNLAYVAQINGFCEDLRKMASKLMTASEVVGQQGANYQAHCDDNIAQVKKLTN